MSNSDEATFIDQGDASTADIKTPRTGRPSIDGKVGDSNPVHDQGVPLIDEGNASRTPSASRKKITDANIGTEILDRKGPRDAVNQQGDVTIGASSSDAAEYTHPSSAGNGRQAVHLGNQEPAPSPSGSDEFDESTTDFQPTARTAATRTGRLRETDTSVADRARSAPPRGRTPSAMPAARRNVLHPGTYALPSMVLVPLEALKARRTVPRSSDLSALVRYRDLPKRIRSFIVFVSHAWLRPHVTPAFAHPDSSSRGGEKYRLIVEAGERIRMHLPKDVRVLFWIDYSCVDQDSSQRSKAAMRGMREYMRRCDAILTVYPGEPGEEGEEFSPNRFINACSWATSYESLAHYSSRAWCRLEMLLGQTEPLPRDGFMFNFLTPKQRVAIGNRPHFLYGAHQRPDEGRIDVAPRQSTRWFTEYRPEDGDVTHRTDKVVIHAVLAKQAAALVRRSTLIGPAG